MRKQHSIVLKQSSKMINKSKKNGWYNGKMDGDSEWMEMNKRNQTSEMNISGLKKIMKICKNKLYICHQERKGMKLVNWLLFIHGFNSTIQCQWCDEMKEWRMNKCLCLFLQNDNACSLPAQKKCNFAIFVSHIIRMTLCKRSVAVWF